MYSLSDGLYYYKVDGSIIFSSSTISIALTASSDGCVTLHKHGVPASVLSWANKARERFLFAGLDDMAGEIHVITGAFSVDDLNKLIECTGFVASLYERFLNNTLLPEGHNTSY